MQKGFVSLEVILVALIISLLATVVVPNAASLVDKAALDYEQKRLYSELQLVRTQNRTATVVSTGMNMGGFLDSKGITVAKRVELELSRGTGNYQVVRDGELVREPHYLSYGVTFDDATSYFPTKIYFDLTGAARFIPIPPSNNSLTLVLKSPRGSKSTIVFDNVGRIRGGK